MKRKSVRVLIWITVSLLVLALLGAGYYLFIYDMRRPSRYQPQMDASFLQTELERLHPTAADSADEVLIEQEGFEGILSYGCSIESVDDIKDYFAYISRNPYDGEHITFSDDSYEIFVSRAYYMPMIKAMGHGWLHRDGNIYAFRNGEEEAEDKPNFRNCFIFTIRKGDNQFVLNMYCNTDSAENALSQAIDYINGQVSG